MIIKGVISWLREASYGFLDFLYPIGCVGCRILGEGYLCHSCMKKVAYIDEPYCKHCGVPLETDKKYCPKCIFDFGFHDGGFSIALYDKPVSDLIMNLKYHREMGIASFLADLALTRLQKINILDDFKCDCIVPVPLFTKRKSSRGFNQSSLIAKHLARSLGLNLREDIIFRIRDTKKQTGLSLDERMANVKNAFQANDNSEIKGKSILILDDVMTTGSTIQECARVLKEAGASETRFLTIARQILYENP